MAAGKLEALDFVILGLHFAITVAVGLWASCRKGRGSAKGYFLAGRDMSWWLVGSSLYMSNIGTGSFIGLSGAAAAVGIAVIAYELAGLFNILLLGYLFIPVYLSSGVYTMPEYLKKRFGGERLQIYIAVLSLLLFILTKLSSEIYCGAIIIQETLGWNLYLSALALLLVTALYTVLGGLAAVIYTDFLQSVVVIIGATIVSIISMVKIGGYQAMKFQYMQAVATNVTANDTCGQPDPYAFNIMRPASDPGYPWPGVVFGANILSAWYFCTDQVLVQRILAAKNLTHARGGSVLAGFLKILPMFMMVWPGLISRVLFPDTVACATPEACIAACGNPSGCSNIAYPKLIVEILPMGLRGLMLAAMLAAMMSSLTSIFNSGSTIFTIDLWKKFRKSASDAEQIIVGRLFILVFLGVAIAWLPMVGNSSGGQLFNYLQSVRSYIASPVIACYLCAILWKRTTEPGAFWGLMVGLAFGLARLIASFVLPDPPCGEPDTRPELISKFHYLHYAIFLFLISLVATIVISLLTKPIPIEKLEGLTWFTKRAINTRKIDSEKAAMESGPPEPKVKDKEEKGKEPIEMLQLDDSTEPIIDMVQPSKARRAWNYICGVDQDAPEISESEKAEMEEKVNALSMTEDPKWSKVVNASAILLAVFGVAAWAFFS